MRNGHQPRPLQPNQGAKSSKKALKITQQPQQEHIEELNQLLTELSEILLKHYVVWAEDVRRCPQEGCDYSGTVNFNPQSELIECSDQLICAKCDHHWRDPAQMRPFDLSLRGIISYFFPTSYEHMANNMKKLMLTEPCPNCRTLIEKNYGCPHMRCAKCNFEFCWTCLGHYKGYRHDDGMGKYCGQSTAAFTGLYVMIVLIFALKIGQLSFMPSRDWLPESPFTYLSEHFSSRYFFYVALRFCVAKACLVFGLNRLQAFDYHYKAGWMALGTILVGYLATQFTHDIVSVFIFEGLLIFIAFFGFWFTLALACSGAFLGCALLVIRTLDFFLGKLMLIYDFHYLSIVIVAGLLMMKLYTWVKQQKRLVNTESGQWLIDRQKRPLKKRRKIA